MAPLKPPQWSDAEFEADIAIGKRMFIAERTQADPDFDLIRTETQSRVVEFFEATNDLRNLTPESLQRDPDFRWFLGYCVMPPISADDLRTLTGSSLGRKVLDLESASTLIDVLVPTWDQHRMPWLREGRGATDSERATAVEVTTALIASERMKTLRRNAPAAIQQNLVSEVLTQAGFTEVPKPNRIASLDQLERGTFCGETLVGPEAAKADRPVRLFDGRLLGIGCKVTNSKINSKKRLLKDIASDAESWRRAFGTSLIPAAVISGVVDLATLKEAQNVRGTFVVWQHNMNPLSEFVRDATT
jgi:hypothetical protein